MERLAPCSLTFRQLRKWIFSDSAFLLSVSVSTDHHLPVFFINKFGEKFSYDIVISYIFLPSLFCWIKCLYSVKIWHSNKREIASMTITSYYIFLWFWVRFRVKHSLQLYIIWYYLIQFLDGEKFMLFLLFFFVRLTANSNSG